MPIRFFYQDVKFKVPLATMHKHWLSHVISKHKHKTGAINIIFCGDEQLLSINKQYLQHDYYTDIITFDYSEGKTINGDLFISIDRVKHNAAQYKVTVLEEVRRVMVHGTLHLLGYNDKTEKEILAMRKAEAKGLKAYAMELITWLG